MLKELAVLLLCHTSAEVLVTLCKPRSRKHTRWLAVHCLMNLYCSSLATRALLDLENHARSFVAASLVHLYHTLFYSLTWEEMIHHFIFIPFICVPGFVWDWGPPSSRAILFLNGIPGAILYGLITYQRCSKTIIRSEPLVTFVVNAFLRFPGAMWAWSSLCVNIPEGVPVFFVALQIILVPTNAAFYTFESFRRWSQKGRAFAVASHLPDHYV